MLDKGVTQWIDKNIKHIITKADVSDISDKEIKILDLLISIKKKYILKPTALEEKVRVIEELICFIGKFYATNLLNFKKIFVHFLQNEFEDQSYK